VASEDYSARHLSVLEGLEAVRKRPGMYIGSTDGRGLMHCLWEIIDNSVDEALAGHGKKVSIELQKDGSVTVEDDGRGVPVDIEPKTGLSGVEVVFTKLHAGGKFGSGSYAASGGLHGVGASVVNALSERLDVEVDRNGQTYAMSFRRGEPGTFDDKKGIGPTNAFKPFVKKSELQILGKVGKNKTGTRVRYWPDPQIFVKETAFDLKEIEDRARQTAFLVPGLLISLNDKRTAKGIKQEFKFEGGISEFVNFLAPDTAVTSCLLYTSDAADEC
jgi:DNA gyrase subunit B